MGIHTIRDITIRHLQFVTLQFVTCYKFKDRYYCAKFIVFYVM